MKNYKVSKGMERNTYQVKVPYKNNPNMSASIKFVPSNYNNKTDKYTVTAMDGSNKIKVFKGIKFGLDDQRQFEKVLPKMLKSIFKHKPFLRQYSDVQTPIFENTIMTFDEIIKRMD